MSSYRSRCGEIRARLLEGEQQVDLYQERDMPGDSTLGRHVRGECICEPAIPPLESVRQGSAVRYRVTEPADCPDCGHSESIETLDGFEPEWHCHGCDRQFGLEALVRTPIVTDGGQETDDTERTIPNPSPLPTLLLDESAAWTAVSALFDISRRVDVARPRGDCDSTRWTLVADVVVVDSDDPVPLDETLVTAIGTVECRLLRHRILRSLIRRRHPQNYRLNGDNSVGSRLDEQPIPDSERNHQSTDIGTNAADIRTDGAGTTTTGPDAATHADRRFPIETYPTEDGFRVDATPELRATISKLCALYSSWAGAKGHTDAQWHYTDLSQQWGAPQPRVSAFDLVETANACEFAAVARLEETPAPADCHHLVAALREHARVDPDGDRLEDGGRDE